MPADVELTWPEGLVRTSDNLTHPIFNTHHSETEILRYVAETYLNHSARSLCDDVVYQTPPMKGAKVGDKLQMDRMRNEKDKDDNLGFSLERLLAGEASAEAGRYRPLREAMDELRARHRA